jgi:hypothetical protein
LVLGAPSETTSFHLIIEKPRCLLLGSINAPHTRAVLSVREGEAVHDSVTSSLFGRGRDLCCCATQLCRRATRGQTGLLHRGVAGRRLPTCVPVEWLAWRQHRCVNHSFRGSKTPRQAFLQGLHDAHAAGMFEQLRAADGQPAATPAGNSSVETAAGEAGAGGGWGGRTAEPAGGGGQTAAVTQAEQVQLPPAGEEAQGAAMAEAIKLRNEGILTDAELHRELARIFKARAPGASAAMGPPPSASHLVALRGESGRASAAAPTGTDDLPGRSAPSVQRESGSIGSFAGGTSPTGGMFRPSEPIPLGWGGAVGGGGQQRVGDTHGQGVTLASYSPAAYPAAGRDQAGFGLPAGGWGGGCPPGGQDAVLMTDGNDQRLQFPVPPYVAPGGFPPAGYTGAAYLPAAMPSLPEGRRLEAALPHMELGSRAVLTVNGYRRLTEGLAEAGPDVRRGLQLLQNTGLDLCHQVSACLGLPWGILYPQPTVPPPPMLSNSDLLRALRTVKDQGGLFVVSPDSPLLKRARPLGQEQLGVAAASFAVAPGMGEAGMRGQRWNVQDGDTAARAQALAIQECQSHVTLRTAETVSETFRGMMEYVTKGFMETQKTTLEAMFNKFEHKFSGGEHGGGPGDEKDDLAAVRKMQLERLNVSGAGGAGNIAVIQVALTRLSEGAKNACNAALTEERSFEQSFGLGARLQIARGEALKKSEYNSPKSPSPTFEAFGNYMAIVFAILTADARHRSDDTAADLHKKQAASFPEGWRALVARIEQENWAGANSQAALSAFVRVVMGEAPSEAERKAWQSAGLGQFMAARRMTVVEQPAADAVSYAPPAAKGDTAIRAPRVVGRWFPDSADLVGPLGRTKSTMCNSCGRVGHDKFECPKLFLDTFSVPMPGHSVDSAKVSTYWHNGEPGNGPAVFVAKAWIAQDWLTGETLQGRRGLPRTAAGDDAWGAWANDACARPLR